MERAVKPLSVVDQKYILCFLNGEDVKTIARRFNVEPASVYTVRYRMKKKFPDAVHLPF
jgi:predicted transcriptional regulator